MFGGLISGITDTVSDLVEDPLGTSVDIATSPLRNSLDFLEGLSEGELRLMAAARVGTDIAAGMAVEELLEFLQED